MVLIIHQNPHKPIDQLNGYPFLMLSMALGQAIDVLDETGARVRLRESSILPEEAKEAQQKLKEVMGQKDGMVWCWLDGAWGWGWCSFNVIFGLIWYDVLPLSGSTRAHFPKCAIDQTLFLHNSVNEALRIACLACRKRPSETKTTSWLVSWRQRTSETIPLFVSIHFTSLPSLVSFCTLSCHEVLALWFHLILHHPYEHDAQSLLPGGDSRQEANLRTKIKSIISESKAAIVDEDEEEASIAGPRLFGL